MSARLKKLLQANISCKLSWINHEDIALQVHKGHNFWSVPSLITAQSAHVIASYVDWQMQLDTVKPTARLCNGWFRYYSQ